MFNFIYLFKLDGKKKFIPISHKNEWSKNLLSYKNFKVMSKLNVLFGGLEKIKQNKIFFNKSNFGVETFFFHWAIIVVYIMILVVAII